VKQNVFGGKNPEITICQGRDATRTMLSTLWLSPEDRLKALERQSEIAQYYQHRNTAARKSHTKTARKTLDHLGIDLKTLVSCRPRDD